MTTSAPPLGTFQEIDDRRLFVHRSGRGGPAVVLLPGASAVGLDYLAVAQEVSRFTTVVLYDRGGTGYSDPLPLPRTAEAVATELHELLRAQGVPAPYVLAAHSLGGAYAHRFAQLHPDEVAGLVWLDAFHRDWDDAVPAAASLAASERLTPGPDQIDALRPLLHDLAVELLADQPEHVRRPLIDARTGDAWIRAGLAERGGLAELAAELRAGPNVPDVPIVALTVVGDDPVPPGTTPEQVHEAKTTLDAALVGAVSHGEQRLVADTAHHRLCVDRADAVVTAIRDVVDRAGRS